MSLTSLARPRRQALRHEPARLPAWPLDTCQEDPPGRIAIMLHAFYPDLLDELGGYLQQMPWPFDLLVSVVREADEALVTERLGGLESVAQLKVRRVVNRGRDIAPLVVAFNAELREYDYVGHLHTKKSPQTGWGERWRRHLHDHLLGSERLIRQLFFHLRHSGVGMVYPPLLEFTPCWSMSWLSNGEIAQTLCQRMGMAFEPRGCFSFPAGSMFWARREALLPLLDLHLSLEDFPEERGQQDGTLQHAIERLLGPVCRQAGWHTAVIDLEAGRLDSFDRLNLWLYLYEPIGQAVYGALPHFEAVTASVMETLVTRPFTRRETMLHCLAERLESVPALGVKNAEAFLALRQQAERRAIQACGHASPSLEQIGRAMVTALGIPEAQAKALIAHEAAFELGLWRLRPALANALTASRDKIAGLVAVSNVPLPNELVLKRLHALGLTAVDASVGPDDAGNTFGRRAFWEWVVTQAPVVGGLRIMHAGSDERDDVQLPWTLDERLTPLYVMRGATLLSLAWRAPGLQAIFDSDDWRDDLWLGLLARRAQNRLDAEPWLMEERRFFDTLEDAGYVLMGPLLLHMLQVWLRWRERFGARTLPLPVTGEHLAARMYARLQTVGRTGRKALPRLRCRPGGTLAQWPMKWLHTPWQKHWFWDKALQHPAIQEGAMQFLDDVLATLGGDWWRFRINETALQALFTTAASGELVILPGLPVAPEHAPQPQETRLHPAC